MSSTMKINAVLDLIQKLDSLEPSAKTTKIRDTVVNTLQEIVVGLWECIANLGHVQANMPPGRDRDTVGNMRRKITEVRDSLQSNSAILAKAYAKGGDYRDQAHFTVLELKSLLTSVKCVISNQT